MLLFVAWRGVKNATRELGNKQSTGCRSCDYGIRGVEPDRLKDICVSQSPRQNIDLVGMKSGPRDAEQLRHSRVVGGRRSDGAGLLRPVTQTGVGGRPRLRGLGECGCV